MVCGIREGSSCSLRSPLALGFFFFSTFFFFPALSFRSSPLCRVTCFHSLLLLSILLMKCKAHIDFLIMRCRAAAVQHFKDILTGPIWANKSRRLKKKRGRGGIAISRRAYQLAATQRPEAGTMRVRFIYLFISFLESQAIRAVEREITRVSCLQIQGEVTV